MNVILEESLKEKNLGNVCFQKEDFAEALNRYQAAIRNFPIPKLNPITNLWEENEPKELSDLRAVICNNIAACYIKMDEFEVAVGYATNTLRTKGFQRNLKALYRRGLSYENLGNYEEALKDYHLILEDDPENEEIRTAISRIENLSQSILVKEEELTTSESVSYTISSHPLGKNDLKINNNFVSVVQMTVPSGAGEHIGMALFDTSLSSGIYHIQIRLATLYYGTVIGLYQHSMRMPHPNFDDYSNSLGYQADGRVDQYHNRYYGNHPFTEGKVVTLEVDATNRTLHFLINRMLQPVSFTQLPIPLRLFVELWEVGDAIEIQSFRRLATSSITAATPRAPCNESGGRKRQPRAVVWGTYEDNFFS